MTTERRVTIPNQELRPGDVLDNGVIVSQIEVLPPAGDGSSPRGAGESGEGVGVIDWESGGRLSSSAFGITMARRYSGER